MYHFSLKTCTMCQKTHVPLQEVAQGFFFLNVCVSSIWCGGVGSSAVPCWCVAACVFWGGPSDLSQPLQHSPVKSNMHRERCSLPSAVTPAVILHNRHSIYVIRRRKTGDDELKVTQTLHTDMHAKWMRLQLRLEYSREKCVQNLQTTAGKRGNRGSVKRRH